MRSGRKSRDNMSRDDGIHTPLESITNLQCNVYLNLFTECMRIMMRAPCRPSINTPFSDKYDCRIGRLKEWSEQPETERTYEEQTWPGNNHLLLIVALSPGGLVSLSCCGS